MVGYGSGQQIYDSRLDYLFVSNHLKKEGIIRSTAVEMGMKLHIVTAIALVPTTSRTKTNITPFYL
jgi:hypothetical protein